MAARSRKQCQVWQPPSKDGNGIRPRSAPAVTAPASEAAPFSSVCLQVKDRASVRVCRAITIKGDPAGAGSRVTIAPANLESDGHRLGGQVVVENRLSHLAPPAGLLVAAKWQRGIEDVEAVDPDGPGLEARSQSVRLADIAGPDSSRQTINRVVGLMDQGIARLRKRRHRYHRAKDLLLHDLHPGLCVHEYRRFDEVS